MIFSIVTPSLNGIRYLDSCIKSVKAQRSSLVAVEHIFVDGGSTDGTPEYAASQGCTVLTREERNLYVAFNKGFHNASGDLIGILGCDDLLLPGALDTVARRYAEDGKPWLVGGCKWLDADGRSRGDQPAPPARASVEMLASLTWSPFSSLATYLEPGLLERLDYFDTSFEIASDYDLLLRARRVSPFTRINRVLAGQHRHGGNTSMQRTELHRQEVVRVNEQYGPSSRFKQRAYATALRAVLNFQSPSWYLGKRVDALRVRRTAS